MEYRPTAWVIGKWISIAALLIYAGLGIVWLVHSQRKLATANAAMKAPTE